MTTVPDYQIGDLIVLKPNLWRDSVYRPGIIIELMFSSTIDEEKRSFLVRFINAHVLIRDRIVWHNDVLEHYPIIK